MLLHRAGARAGTGRGTGGQGRAGVRRPLVRPVGDIRSPRNPAGAGHGFRCRLLRGGPYPDGLREVRRCHGSWGRAQDLRRSLPGPAGSRVRLGAFGVDRARDGRSCDGRLPEKEAARRADPRRGVRLSGWRESRSMSGNLLPPDPPFGGCRSPRPRDSTNEALAGLSATESKRKAG